MMPSERQPGEADETKTVATREEAAATATSITEKWKDFRCNAQALRDKLLKLYPEAHAQQMLGQSVQNVSGNRMCLGKLTNMSKAVQRRGEFATQAEKQPKQSFSHGAN